MTCCIREATRVPSDMSPWREDILYGTDMGTRFVVAYIADLALTLLSWLATFEALDEHTSGESEVSPSRTPGCSDVPGKFCSEKSVTATFDREGGFS
jgi:hypothetical protein